MHFPSKKDVWMAIIIWLSIFVFIIPPIFAIEPIGVIMLPSILNNKLITMIIMIVPALLLSWIWFDTGYKIEESKIMVKSGPYRKTINIKEISSVRTTKNPFAAPALSIDKIEINYGNFEIVTISPRNKDEFIYQLQKRNPEIQIDNHF